MLIIRVQSFGHQSPVRYEVPAGPFDIGRGAPVDDVPRCVVTGDPAVSRHHARLTAEGPGRVTVTNTSQRVNIASAAGVIGPGESKALPLPATLKLGDTTVFVEHQAEQDGGFAVHTLASLGPSPLLRSRASRLAAPVGATHDAAAIAGWFETLIAVQQAPAGSPAFYAQTARALVEQIGMDIGLVLLRKPPGWAVTARHAANDEGSGFRGREFSITVLERAANEKRTIYQAEDVPTTESLAQVTGLVAAPVILPNGDVAGALYGVRHTFRGRSISISPLEAQLVQVLATAVGVGLARVAQEEETALLRVQLHQQFNERLARELEGDLSRLAPQDREITILFADIRGFSRISEVLGPAETFQFVSEVMEVLTESVKRHDGAIMDYVGDELIALWNAPADHANHAGLAMGCAAELAADLTDLSTAWAARLGGAVRIGVGLNSGLARVGNTGTRSKPKYGALGHTVNVASRVQGATKAFGCTTLLTGATRTRLPTNAAVRRIGMVKVVGIQEPVELFQPADDLPAEVAQGYAAALARYEAGDLAGTVEVLNALLKLPAARVDGPTRQLAVRVEALTKARTKEYTPVIELRSK